MTLRPNKLLGQHFLVSSEVLERITEVSDIQPDETILEIGPGTGVLTRKLSKKAKKIISVEKDRALFEQLQQELSREGVRNVSLMHGDILKLPAAKLVLPPAFSVVSNIPYYLTGHLIRLLLERDHRPEHMVLMVQKEVAERMMAKPPSLNMLALSVQAFSTPKIEFFVPTSAFSPKPKVDSAVISISRISTSFFGHNKVSPESFFRIARAGFQHRRKTLANSLALSLDQDLVALQSLLKKANIDNKRRAESLSLEEWATLVRLWNP